MPPKSPRGQSPKDKKKKEGKKEPLMEASNIELASMVVNEAMQLRYFDNYPRQPEAVKLYKQFYRVKSWAHLAVLGLLMLTMFETPLWCRNVDASYWDWGGAYEKCVRSQSLRHGIPEAEIVVTGLPMLPLGVSLLIEYFLLALILRKVVIFSKMQSYFVKAGSPYKPNAALIFDYAMILLALCDAFYFSFFPIARHRIAPMVRCGLALSIPWVLRVVQSFWKATKSISAVGGFLLGTVVIFAWLAAMIFDDLKFKDQYGLEVDQGFENFGNSIYTMFVTMTTANLPDVIIPTYAYSKETFFFWIPFFILAVCLFTQVILATVYSEYQDELTDQIKTGHENRSKSVNCAFDLMKSECLTMKSGKAIRTVNFNAFLDLVNEMKTFSSLITMDENSIKFLFAALDQDKNETLTRDEFKSMCEILMTRFTVTQRDSVVRKNLEGTSAGKTLAYLMTSPDQGDGPDMGVMTANHLPFDFFMNCVLGFNVFWLVLESCYDLNDLQTPDWFDTVDLVFSFVYVVEVSVKLSWWSWEEYWTSIDNRFDFFTTVVLAGVGVQVLFSNISSAVLKYVNLLRLLRLLKALNNIPAYEKTVRIIARMCSTCGDVLAMNMLVIYLWSAWGMQLFGGQLYKSNPAYEDADGLDYFDSNFEVLNFNDMVAGMLTMFIVTFTSWVDPVTVACLGVYKSYSFNWYLSGFFWLSFYIGSPLIAFNVWTAFSIDVFCKLEDMEEHEEKASPIEENLKQIQTDMANNDGICLHIQASPALVKERVYKAMFDESDDSEDGGEGEDKEEEAPSPEETTPTRQVAPLYTVVPPLAPALRPRDLLEPNRPALIDDTPRSQSRSEHG